MGHGMQQDPKRVPNHTREKKGGNEPVIKKGVPEGHNLPGKIRMS